MLKAIVFFILLICSTTYAETNTPVVIVQTAVVETKLDVPELVHIFTRKQMFWSDGHKIKVFTKKTDSIEHKLFTMNVLNLTPYHYRTLLDSVIYSGSNTSVIEVSSDEEMILKVSSTPYSIGYLNYNTIITNISADYITIHYE